MESKVALIFWWLALTPQPNVGMSSSVVIGNCNSVGNNNTQCNGGGMQSEVVVQGIHQMKPVLFANQEMCSIEQKRLAEAHRNDLVIFSVCGGAGHTALLMQMFKSIQPIALDKEWKMNK